MYQVVGWNDNFEVAKTRSFKNKTTCTMPCKHGLGFRLIASNQEGAAIFGAWCAMIQIISRHKAPRAGYLTSDGTDSGRPYTADDLHVLTGIPSKYFSLMFDLCSSESVGWLMVIEPTDTTRIPHGYHEDTMRILCDHLNSNLNSNLNYDSSEAPELPSKPDEDKNGTEAVQDKECKSEGEDEGSMLSAAQREQAKNPPRQRVNDNEKVLLSFPCVGPVKEWHLVDSKLAEWVEAYAGSVSIMDECKKARQWLLNNPTRRKTANGMPRFLNSWITRAVDRNRGPSGSGPIEVA